MNHQNGMYPDIRKVLSHYAKADQVIFSVLKTMDLKPLTANNNEATYFQALCQNIVGQQLSGKVADVIFARFEAMLPDGISPSAALQLTEPQLRGAGLSNAKVKYVRDLAAKVSSGTVSLTGFGRMSNQAIIDELVKVKGIGNWTAEMFLIFTLGREDVFSLGDLGLKNAFKKLYEVDDHDVKIKMAETTLKWTPYRSYGCLALWHSLESV